MAVSIISDSSILPAGVEFVVMPRLRPLGGLSVNRVWPIPRRRMVGPFIFFDHLQRAELAPGRGLDVPPHPHIGLATVTYLFEGELVHRDSLGCTQTIRPGELNWMNAGAGIVHSERSSDVARAGLSYLHGIQSWVALPRSAETSEPSFQHYPGDDVPLIESRGVHLRLLAGAGFGARSRVQTLSDLFYVEADCRSSAGISLGAELGERAAYVVSGRVGIEQGEFEAGQLIVFAGHKDIQIRALAASKLMLFGGAPVDGERHIWWNFVASSSERIEQAKQDWRARRFPPVPGDAAYMPAPD